MMTHWTAIAAAALMLPSLSALARVAPAAKPQIVIDDDFT